MTIPDHDAFELSLAKLSRAVLHEGNAAQREVLTEGKPIEPVWPAEFPAATPELLHWFAWAGPYAEVVPPADGWRSLEWASFARLSFDVELPGTLVPVYGEHAIDVAGGAVWVATDEHGSYARTELVGLCAVLDLLTQRFLARRGSPWRKQRVALVEEAVVMDAFPTPEAMVEAAVGTAYLHGTTATMSGRRRSVRRATLFVKQGPNSWFEVRRIGDAAWSMEAGLSELRSCFASGEGPKTSDDARVAAEVAKKAAKLHSGGPWEMQRAPVRLWTQPSFEALLERFGRALPPNVRATLAPPAAERDIEALETTTGPLPPQLRALWRFANGQTNEPYQSLYLTLTLASVDAARRSIEMHRILAQNEFDEPYWTPGLVPFLEAIGGDAHCVDVAGDYGPPGCILDFDHNRAERRSIVFEDLSQWLECLVDAWEAGREEILPGDEITRVRTNEAFPSVALVPLRPGSYRVW